MFNHRLNFSTPLIIVLCVFGFGAFAQLKVSGRYLNDACGERVVLRGVNEMFIYSSDRTGAVTYPEIAKTGANAVRFMWMTDSSVPVSDFESNIRNCVANKMIPIAGLWNATGKWGTDLESCVQWWLKPEVVTVCRNNPYMILNIANEAGNAQMSDYTSVYSSAIQRIRNAGITNAIMVDADGWGRAWQTIRDKGTAVLNADPQKNVIFSWHSWDTNIDYATPINTMVAQNLCVVVGEFSYKSVGCSCCIDYGQVLSASQAQSVGVLAWSWGLVKNGDCTDGSMDMTTNGTFAGLKSGWATEVATTNANSIKNTAVRPYSIQNNGACRPSGTTVTVNDATTGTSTNQFQYVSTWSTSTGTGKYNGDDHYSATTNAYFNLRFNGTKVAISGAKASHHGIYAFSIDGGAETLIDCYSATRIDQTVLWTSPTLSNGAHTVKGRVTGTKNGSSTGFTVSIDKADITGGSSTSTTTLNPVADTDTQSDNATGTNTTLNASQWNTMFSKFSLTGIGQVTSATLRYYSNVTTAGTLNASSASPDSWTEGGTKPTAGSLITSISMPTGARYFELDVTNAVRTEANGDDLITFAITTNLGSWTGFNSRENAANKPQLVVTYSTTGRERTEALLSLNAPEESSREEVSIFPNPAGNQVEITFSCEREQVVPYRLINSLDQVVTDGNKQALPGKNSISVNTAACKNGVYFILLEKDGKRVARRVVIAR